MTETPDRTESIFAATVELPTAERAEFLDRQCAGDPALRERLDALLRAHDRAGHLLDRPANCDSERTGTYTPANEEPSTVIAGRYKLLQQIGEGGMGCVWMADQLEPVKRRVAMKLVRAEREGSRTILSRFEAERQAIALMDHPNIAKLLDAGTSENGSPFFVMELVKGVPLSDFCDEHRLSIPDRLKLFIQICGAVQHAHQKGIIHRDLKPTNVLVELHDDNPVPRVIDFGLAKAMSGQPLTEHTLFTEFGTVAGTPLYMAPEQAKFNAVDIDTRADIYALGVMLYELLTGSTPIERKQFKRAALDEMLRMIRESEPPTPSKRLSSAETTPSVAANRHTEPTTLGRLIKGELDWIVMKALAKERDRRYETASGFAKDIERFLNDEPVSAGPPSATYRLGKFIQRNRVQVIAASLILLALVLGIVGTSWGMAWALNERNAKAKALLAETQAKAAEKQAKQEALSAAAAEKTARQHAETAEAEAKRDLAKFEAINEFLTNDLLTQAEPGHNAAEDQVSLLEVLDRAAEKVESRFADQPELEQALRVTIMHTYHGLASWKKAESQARALLEQLQQRKPGSAERYQIQAELAHMLWHCGRRDAEVVELAETAVQALERISPDRIAALTASNHLATIYENTGRLPEAIALFERNRDTAIAMLGPDNPHTLTTINNLARAYQCAGKPLEAIALYEQVRDANMAMVGPDHPETLTTLDNLGSAYRDLKRFPEAIALFERVRDAKISRLGPDHSDTLVTLNNLATAYIDVGKYPEAIALLERARDAMIAKLGFDHPNTLLILENLAPTYRDTGKLPEAIALYERIGDAKIAKFGPDHPETLMTLNNLATAYWSAQRLDKSVPLFEDVLKRREATLGPDHPDTQLTLSNLGVNYKDSGRIPEAIAILERLRDARIAKLGPDHPDTLRTLNDLAASYDSAGRDAEAIALFERVSERQFATLGPDHSDRLMTNANIAALYWKTKRLDKSIPLFEDVLKRREANFGRQGLETLSTVANLGVNYKDAGRLKEAIPLLEEAHQAAQRYPTLRGFAGALMEAYAMAGENSKLVNLLQEQLAEARKVLPMDSPQLAGLLAQIGSGLLEQKKWTEAEPLLRECLAIRETQEPDDWRMFNTLSLLGGALLGQQKYAEAEPLLLDGYKGMNEREVAIPPQGRIRLSEALHRLVDFYSATDQAEKADEWRAKLEMAQPKEPEAQP